MTLPLTPDDVRAIVREELGLDRPLSPDVVATILGAKTGRYVVRDPRLSELGLKGKEAGLELPHGAEQDGDAIEQGQPVLRPQRERGDGVPADDVRLGDVIKQVIPGRSTGHIDSSSVVPGVAPSGDDATVEAPGDAARPDSPRRVVAPDERHAAHAYLVGYLSQVLATSGRDMQGLIESLHSRGRHVEADLLAADQEAVAR